MNATISSNKQQILFTNLEEVLKNNFKCFKQFLYIEPFQIFQIFNDCQFLINLKMANAKNFIMRHNNCQQTIEILKQLLADLPNLFYITIIKEEVQKFPIRIDLAIFDNPLLLNYFQKTDIIINKQNNNEWKIFNFVPLQIFKKMEFQDKFIYLTVKKQFFGKKQFDNLFLINNFSLYYAHIDENNVFLSYDSGYINCCCDDDEQKLNFIKAFLPYLKNFKIIFASSKIEFHLFDRPFSLNFKNCYDSFDDIIKDIFNSLENCECLLSNVKKFNFLNNNDELNNVKNAFVELFKFLLEYNKFRKI